MHPPLPRTLLLGSLLTLLPPISNVAAKPPPDTPDKLPVCTVFRDQKVAAATPDGSGGAIVAWLDGRNGFTWVAFAQHVRSDLTLDPAWPTDGVAPHPVSLGEGDVAIAPDGVGGAILAWQEGRSVASGTTTVIAQHILANGTVDPRWPVGGRPLAPSTGDQIETALVSDGTGGAIAAWLDRRSYLAFQTFAQHVLADGTIDPAWPAEGRQVSNAPTQSNLRMVTDGAGGAILAWGDFRARGQEQFAAQRVLLDGTIDARWPSDGRVLTSDKQALQYGLDLISDGVHGAIFAWNSSEQVQQHVVVQRVREDGGTDAAWSDTGRVVSRGVANQYEPILGSDGKGGAYVAWEEIPDSLVSMHLQHLSAAGVVDPSWPATGLALGSPRPAQGVTNIVADGEDGALINWVVTSQGALYGYSVQHLESSGHFDSSWPTDGQPLFASTPVGSFPLAIVPGENGGEIAAWSERGTPSQGIDVFAEAVKPNGRLVGTHPSQRKSPGNRLGVEGDVADVPVGGVVEALARLTFAGGSPNPLLRAGPTVLRFALPRAERAKLEVFDSTGRRIAVLVDRALPAGPDAAVWDGRDTDGRAVGPGVYFYRLTAGGEKLTSKGLRL